MSLKNITSEELDLDFINNTKKESINLMVDSIFKTKDIELETSSNMKNSDINPLVRITKLDLKSLKKCMGCGMVLPESKFNNTNSNLVTRGLAEMTRLGLRLGANPMTLAGLGGLGDLVLTCTSRQSRNFQVGLRLGQGETLSQILASTRMVAEGIKNSLSFHLLAQRLAVDMPLVEAVYRILYEDLSPRDTVKKLMTRELKDELEAMEETW